MNHTTSIIILIDTVTFQLATLYRIVKSSTQSDQEAYKVSTKLRGTNIYVDSCKHGTSCVVWRETNDRLSCNAASGVYLVQKCHWKCSNLCFMSTLWTSFQTTSEVCSSRGSRQKLVSIVLVKSGGYILLCTSPELHAAIRTVMRETFLGTIVSNWEPAGYWMQARSWQRQCTFTDKYKQGFRCLFEVWYKKKTISK